MPMQIADILAGLKTHRDEAQAIVDACQRAIDALGGTVAEKKPPVTRPRRATPKPRVTAQTQSAPVVPAESKVGKYRAAILSYLKRWDVPNHCADTTVLRREVAKACGVDIKKDAAFRGDVSNALTSLKAQGLVERSGDVWALTEKAMAA